MKWSVDLSYCSREQPSESARLARPVMQVVTQECPSRCVSTGVLVHVLKILLELQYNNSVRLQLLIPGFEHELEYIGNRL